MHVQIIHTMHLIICFKYNEAKMFFESSLETNLFEGFYVG